MDTNNNNENKVLTLLIEKITELETRVEKLELGLKEPESDIEFIDSLGLDEEQAKAMKMMMALGMEKSDIKEMILKSIK